MKTFWFALCSMLLLTTLTACGDDGGDQDSYTIQVQVDGVPDGEAVTLALEVTAEVWENPNDDEPTVKYEQVETLAAEDGTSNFEYQVPASESYTVVILTQPEHATCRVENGSGEYTGASEEQVSVSCDPVGDWNLGGTVSGLPENESFVITESHSDQAVTVSENGEWNFDTDFSGDFELEISTQPEGATCTVEPSSGTLDDDVSVVVTCTSDSTPKFEIGGTLAGLPTSATIVLQNNGGDDLVLTDDGDFAFDTHTVDYEVTVKAQPDGADCIVDNGSGTATADVSDVTVSCTPTTPVFEIGGTLSGLPATASLVLQNNGGDDLTLTDDGDFTFDTQVSGDYEVTVKTQPEGADCTVTHDSGTATANVSDITVTCVPTIFAIGGTLTGLPESRSIALKNNSEDLALDANGAFSFDTHADDYNVIIVTQPIGAVCTLANGSGTATADVTNVSVTCIASGTLDLTFGDGDGWARYQPTYYHNEWYGLALNPDDSMTVCGRNQIYGADEEWGISKLTTTGAFDTFGTDGTLKVSGEYAIGERAQAIRRANDGSFYVAGQLTTTMGFDFTVAKVTALGAFDEDYATAGLATYPVPGAQTVSDMALYDSGAVLAVGRSDAGPDGDMFLVRFDAAGEPDTGFGSDGMLFSGTVGLDEARGVAVDAAGGIVVVGFSGDDSVVWKFHANGTPDDNFGTDGIKVTDFSGMTLPDHLQRVQIDANGFIVAAGTANNGTNDDFLIIRLAPNGDPDDNFGTDGVVKVDNDTDNLYALRIAPDGKILYGGITGLLAALGRLNDDGSIDTGFADQGLFTNSFSSFASNINDIGIDSHDKIVVVGSWAETNPDFGVARLNP